MSTRKIKNGLIQVTCSINKGEYCDVYHVEDGESMCIVADWLMDSVLIQLNKSIDDNERMYLTQEEWDKMLDIFEVYEVKQNEDSQIPSW